MGVGRRRCWAGIGGGQTPPRASPTPAPQRLPAPTAGLPAAPSSLCLLTASSSPQSPRPQLQCFYSSDRPLSLPPLSPPLLPLSAFVFPPPSPLLPLPPPLHLSPSVLPSPSSPPPPFRLPPSSKPPPPPSPPSLPHRPPPSFPPSLRGKKGHRAADYSELSCCSNRRGKWDRLALRTREVGRGRLEPARASVLPRAGSCRQPGSSAAAGPAAGFHF